ncbi:MAG: DUF3857 domain-containing protein [Ignavibacteriae bacterium]|nr:DUF3857 domain-containing protein [Ignavibacteriota bacterium]NOH00099.1 DUF3857 domain-containing protein [Ignavibacteriota bacterium]
MKLLLSLLTVLFLITTTNSQDFGDITEEELLMNTCLEDPDADAVILFNKRNMRITSDFHFVSESHKRIKILTEAGKKYANQKIVYWHEDKITDLDAICYLPNGDEIELDSDNIFEEEGEKTITLSFAIPGVEIGSVIEYEYQHWSDRIHRLEPWKFQEESFTKLNQLELMLPLGFNYNLVTLNTEAFDFTQSAERTIDPHNPRKKIGNYKWTAKNVEGIVEEPFLDNIDDKYAKIYFILHSYQDSYSKLNFNKTWDYAAEILSKHFNKLFDQSGITEDKAIELASQHADHLEKAKQIYNFIKSEIKLGEHTTLWGEKFKEPEKVLEDRQGSSSEKNMLLINMLRHAGLDAKPLFISTRSHGYVIQDFVEYAQFNRLICKLRVNNKDYFLHSAFAANPFGYLTPATDVGIGLLVDDDRGVIISMNPIKPLNKTDYKTVGSINDEGAFKGKTVITYKGFNALTQRNKIEDEIPSEVKKQVEKLVEDLYSGAKLDSFYYSGADDCEVPLELNLSYTLPDYIEETDELVYFSFPLFSAISENPFKRERRTYSIDFRHAQLITEEIKLMIPDKLKLLEVPGATKSGVTNYTYTKLLFSGKNYIKCTRISNLRTRSVHQREYKQIKQMYEKMISSDQEQIVFQHKDEELNVDAASRGKK